MPVALKTKAYKIVSSWHGNKIVKKGFSHADIPKYGKSVFAGYDEALKALEGMG